MNKKSNIFKRYFHSISLSLIFEFKLQAQFTSSKAQTDRRPREAHRNSMRLVEGPIINRAFRHFENDLYVHREKALMLFAPMSVHG